MNMQIICTNAKHSSSNYHNIKIDVNSEVIPVEAQNAPITADRIEKQISKTNNTPFVFENITIDLDDNVYIPSISSLNELRRNALEMLEAKVIANKNRTGNISVRDFNNRRKTEILEHPKNSLHLRQLTNDVKR